MSYENAFMSPVLEEEKPKKSFRQMALEAKRLQERERESRANEHMKNEAVIRFDLNDVQSGLITQKFVLLKTKDSYIFGTVPESEAKEHLDMIKVVAQEKGIDEKDYQEMGGGSLGFDVSENTIWFDTNSRSFKLGVIKISWEEIQ